jgi:hypothetical protein
MLLFAKRRTSNDSPAYPYCTLFRWKNQVSILTSALRFPAFLAPVRHGRISKQSLLRSDPPARLSLDGLESGVANPLCHRRMFFQKRLR